MIRQRQKEKWMRKAWFSMAA